MDMAIADRCTTSFRVIAHTVSKLGMGVRL